MGKLSRLEEEEKVTSPLLLFLTTLFEFLQVLSELKKKGFCDGGGG